MTSEVCSSVAAVSSRIRQHTNWYYGHQAQTVGLKPGINFDLKWSYPYTISVCLHWLYKIDVYIYEFNPRPLRNWQKKQYLWPKLKNYTIWRGCLSQPRLLVSGRGRKSTLLVSPGKMSNHQHQDKISAIWSILLSFLVSLLIACLL